MKNKKHKTIFIFLVEIYQRERKYIEWIDREAKERGVLTFIIYKDDFYHNIIKIAKKFDGYKVFVFDKSYQSYMHKKLYLLKKVGFGVVLRDEEFLVRLTEGLSPDRYSKINALLADAITVWGDQERDLLVKEGISNKKLFYGNAVRYKYDKISNSNSKKYDYIIISSFGDLFPINGVMHINHDYIKHLEYSLLEISKLITQLRMLGCYGKIRFHPFEDVYKIMNRLSELGVIFDDFLIKELPGELSLEKSLLESKIIIHIGSTISYDYIYMTQGLKTFMIPSFNNMVHGPEKISIILDVDQLIEVINSKNFVAVFDSLINDSIKMPSDVDLKKLIDYLLDIETIVNYKYFNIFSIISDIIFKSIRTVRRTTISRKRFDAADKKRISITSLNIANYLKFNK